MLRIGACSWKYESWKGLVYSNSSRVNYLKEYSQYFNTVEIDHWFWSLFPPDKAELPIKNVVEAYKKSIPDDFLFTIKVPNSITLTHFYKKNKSDQLKANPYFLSAELYGEFLNTLKPINKNVGCLIFQFEYLNKQKMNSLPDFQERFRNFISTTSRDVTIGIEIRNPNYLTKPFFQFLNELDIAPVFFEGYYMPPITEVYDKHSDYISGKALICLHGPDRKGIEKMANDNWSKIYINRDQELEEIIKMIKHIQSKEVDLFVNVNNHFEGSAPLTIKKIKDRL